jgi:uncharacterized protein (DUF952 family)
MTVIFKIVARAEWARSGDSYQGSAHDRSDGFLHFSSPSQLEETLRRHYADQDDLVLIAVEAEKLGDMLKWEYAPSRDEDFPHLYGPLARSAVLWTRPLEKKDGRFLLPAGVEEVSS